MKMQSYRNRNALLAGVNWPVGLFLLVLVAGALLLRFLAPGVLTQMATPLWKAGDFATAAVGVPAASLSDASSVRSENERLLEERSALQAENAVLKERLADLGAPGESVRGVPAGVLSRPPVSAYDTLTVALTDSVSVGARVYAPGGIPVGVVDSVNGSSARIALFSEAGRQNEGWVGEARNPITLTGESAGAFSAIVPRDAALTEGETVFLPGPGALPVGYIVRIDRDPSSPEARVHVRPVVNPFALTWVLIDTTSYD